MEKNIVSLENKRCAICDRTYSNNALLLQTKGLNKPRLEPVTVTGLGICPDCHKEGFTPFVVIDTTRSNRESVYKTGEVIHIKNEVIPQIFNKTFGEFSFIDQEGAERLKGMMEHPDDDTDNEKDEP